MRCASKVYIALFLGMCFVSSAIATEVKRTTKPAKTSRLSPQEQKAKAIDAENEKQLKALRQAYAAKNDDPGKPGEWIMYDGSVLESLNSPSLCKISWPSCESEVGDCEPGLFSLARIRQGEVLWDKVYFERANRPFEPCYAGRFDERVERSGGTRLRDDLALGGHAILPGEKEFMLIPQGRRMIRVDIDTGLPIDTAGQEVVSLDAKEVLEIKKRLEEQIKKRYPTDSEHDRAGASRLMYKLFAQEIFSRKQ